MSTVDDSTVTYQPPLMFYVGSHQPQWLARTVMPLFVSHRRLRVLKKLPRAICSWALDSGGFSELSMYGEWRSSTTDYIAATKRYADEIGSLRWAAIRDWMCEPFIVAKTGLTVREHQRHTVDSYLKLMTLAPDLPWIPVLQGFTLGEYKQCWDDYNRAGVDLANLPLVGIGSICRRQHTDEIATIVRYFSEQGLQPHGFGVKIQGLTQFAQYLTSADSMAWSFATRRQPPMPGHAGHINCANCRTYAELWYRLKVQPLLWRTNGTKNETNPSPARAGKAGLFTCRPQQEDLAFSNFSVGTSASLQCDPNYDLSNCEQ